MLGGRTESIDGRDEYNWRAWKPDTMIIKAFVALTLGRSDGSIPTMSRNGESPPVPTDSEGRDHAISMCLPGIGSASAARHAGARNVSAKYCVS